MHTNKQDNSALPFPYLWKWFYSVSIPRQADRDDSVVDFGLTAVPGRGEKKTTFSSDVCNLIYF